MKQLFKKSFITLILLVVLGLPLASSAALNIDSYSDKIAEMAGYQTTEVQGADYLDTTIGKAIAIIMGFVGIIFFIMILISGFQWLTAGGNEDKAKHAKDRVVSATVGFLIVASAYLITYFIYQTIQGASEGGEPNNWWQEEGGYDCQYNSDCPDDPSHLEKIYCDWRDVHSFCAECLTDTDCGNNQNGNFCCNYVLESVCSSDESCAD